MSGVGEGCGPNCKYKQIEEVWKEMDRIRNYLVSNHGRVKNKTKDKILSGNKKAYIVFIIENKNVRAHRLVAETFFEDKEKASDPNYVVNHKNGVKHDNHCERVMPLDTQMLTKITNAVENGNVQKKNNQNHKSCSSPNSSSIFFSRRSYPSVS